MKCENASLTLIQVSVLMWKWKKFGFWSDIRLRRNDTSVLTFAPQTFASRYLWPDICSSTFAPRHLKSRHLRLNILGVLNVGAANVEPQMSGRKCRDANVGTQLSETQMLRRWCRPAPATYSFSEKEQSIARVFETWKRFPGPKKYKLWFLHTASLRSILFCSAAVCSGLFCSGCSGFSKTLFYAK
jgi:hypothetical protein